MVYPNMSTKVPQAFLLNKKMPRTKLPTINQEMFYKVYQKLKAHGKIMKDKMKEYFDNRYHKKNRQIQIRNCVLVKQSKISKLLLPFKAYPYFAKCIKGSVVTAKRRNKSMTRNKEHAILLPSITKINRTIKI